MSPIYVAPRPDPLGGFYRAELAALAAQRPDLAADDLATLYAGARAQMPKVPLSDIRAWIDEVRPVPWERTEYDRAVKELTAEHKKPTDEAVAERLGQNKDARTLRRWRQDKLIP